MGNSRYPRWRVRDGQHLTITMSLHHVTSSLFVVDLKGNIFGRTVYPPSLIDKAFILAKLCIWGGGGGVGIKKKPGLDRIQELGISSANGTKAMFTRDRSQVDPTLSWNGSFLFTRHRSTYQRQSTRDWSLMVRY